MCTWRPGTRPCTHWAQMRCNYGDACGFSHDGPGGASERGIYPPLREKLLGEAAASQAEPCRFFAASGKCKNGDSCRFSHGGAAVQRNLFDLVDSEVAVTLREPCRYFAGGRCKNGTACRFSHEREATARGDTGVSSRQPLQKPLRAPLEAPQATPCKFYARGECEKGRSCRYSHEASSSSSSRGAGREAAFSTPRLSPIGDRPPLQTPAVASNLQKPGPGDWSCPSCNDMQFKRNATCRICGTARPLEAHPLAALIIPAARNKDQGLKRPAEAASLADYGPAKAPCKYFAEGHCRNGDSCRFSHERAKANPLAALASANASSRAGAACSATPCKFFADGFCEKGLGCRFSHQSTPASAGSPSRATLVSAQDRDRPGDWYCPSCDDLQFARNDQCRLCGTAQPQEGLQRSASGGRHTSNSSHTSSSQFALGIAKVRETIRYYNTQGGLAQPIDEQEVLASLELMEPKQALSILAGLKDKGGSIANPTSWIKKACLIQGSRCELETEVKRNIAWLNENGNLQSQIRIDEVVGPLSRLQADVAVSILSGLEGVARSQVRDPTKWILRAVKTKLELGEGVVPYGGDQADTHSKRDPPWRAHEASREDASLRVKALARFSAYLDNEVHSAEPAWKKAKVDSSSAGAGGSVPCKYFAAKGDCRNGSSCRFSHEAPAKSLREAFLVRRDDSDRYSSQAPAWKQAKEDKPASPALCKFFAEGYCEKGASCRYQHPHEEKKGPPVGSSPSWGPRAPDSRPPLQDPGKQIGLGSRTNGASSGPSWAGKGSSGKSAMSAAKYEGFLDSSVKQAVGWWNKKGGCGDQISYNVVAPMLAQFEPESAVQLLNGLDGRVGSIKDFNAWICNACKKQGATR